VSAGSVAAERFRWTVNGPEKADAAGGNRALTDRGTVRAAGGVAVERLTDRGTVIGSWEADAAGETAR